MDRRNDYLNNFIRFLFILFMPVLLLVDHLSSFIYLLLTMLGVSLYFYGDKVKFLSDEKKVFNWFLLFFLLSVVSMLYQHIVNGQFYPEADNKLQVYLNFGVVYFIFASALNLEKPFFVLKQSLVITAVLLFVVGSYEFVILSRQAKGISHHLVYGDVSNIVGIALLILSMFEKNKIYKNIFIVAGVLSLIACIYSGARGAWITWPVVMVLVWLWMKEYRTKILLVSVIVTMVFIISYHVQSTGVAKRIDQAIVDIVNYKQGINKGSSLGARFEMWSASLEVIKKNPVLGVGIGGYQPSIQNITGNKIAASYLSPHNTYINALVTQGILGLITVFGLFFSITKYFYSGIYSKSDQTKAISYIAILLVFSYMIYSLTVSVFDGMALTTMYVYMTALLIASYRKEEQHEAC
ncbi:MAG: O-antigen ligase family protein [Gammaproteobacteria bacterium]|nr:O-antigen ligase family protein [Gammaproteobacteria bacterium]